MATTDQEIQQLELLCKHLYEATETVQRTEAEKALVNFQNSPEALVKCQLLLERAASSYAQLIAANTLTKLIKRPVRTISLLQRIQIKNYVLSYLSTRIGLDTHVVQSLAVLFANVTKLGWFDTEKEKYVFRNVIADVGNFLQGSVEHCARGVQLLSVLTCEINKVSDSDAYRSLAKQRKIASSFRDECLLEIFRLSCTLLKKALETRETINFEDRSQYALMNQLMELAHNCLTFDFVGTATDDLSDDLYAVQIPSNWRPLFLEVETLQTFFDLYHVLPAGLSPKALSCLTQIVSVRRSFFSNCERVRILNHFMNGMMSILRNPTGLGDINNYHEFCRLLARLKCNFQLGELVVTECYPEAIELFAKFAVDSLRQMLHLAPNSVFYVLGLWQRLVSSMPYVKATQPHLLEKYAPEIARAYITSRFESIALCIREGSDDPLDDMAMVKQQLEQLAVIFRCEYQKTCSLVVQLFEETAQNYYELLQRSCQAQPVDLTIQEGQLIWLVYIIGACVSGRVSLSTHIENDNMDGELVCRVFQLMQRTDALCGQGGSERLEMAYLFFLEHFRTLYVGDQPQKAPKVFERLSEVLGVHNENLLLNLYIRKIITNLKCWNRSELILSSTLNLLYDLSVAPSSIRQLVRLTEVQFMLNNHTAEHFPFLKPDQTTTDLRLRTIFYKALGRLMFANLGENENQFHTFMAPLTAQMERIGQMLASGAAVCQSECEIEVKRRIMGLARDLRGIIYSINQKVTYRMFFDWIYPTYTPIFQRAVELWYHDPDVTTPVFKLFAEFVMNRSRRLEFDVSSPNGILLFREASKMICSYGNRILTVDVPVTQLYPLKLKGVLACFSMLKAAISGNFVNFGVFRLYGDNALQSALDCIMKLLLSISLSDLMDFPKLSVAYYSLIECVAQDHMNYLATLDPNVFLYILASVAQGLPASDTMVCSGCCATLDNIVSYIFRQRMIKNKKVPLPFSLNGENQRVLETLEQRPEILQRLLETVLNIVVFEECRNQWSMSRPLLGLILLNEEYFGQLRDNVVRCQPPERQTSTAQRFEDLMKGIERDLNVTNRDRFTQNLSVFRRDINEPLKSPVNYYLNYE